MWWRTAELIARASTLHADLAALCAESRTLIERTGQRWRTSLLRVIRGGSDAAPDAEFTRVSMPSMPAGDLGLITTVIAGAALCVDCITRRTGIPAAEVSAALPTIGSAFQVAAVQRRCSACLETKAIYSLRKGGARRSSR